MKERFFKLIGVGLVLTMLIVLLGGIIPNSDPPGISTNDIKMIQKA